jgi:hypothetical protein
LAVFAFTFELTMGYLLLAILLYIAYRFIAGFVIPVARTTSQVRQQFQSMKEQMEQAQRQQADPDVHQDSKRTNQKPKFDVEGEYISYEDIK